MSGQQLHQCARGGYLVNATAIVPSDPTVLHVERLPVIGCSRLVCGQCHTDVRNLPGLTLSASESPSQATLSELYDNSHPARLQPEADCRLYLCRCSAQQERSQHACIEPDPDPLTDLYTHWQCAGHPSIEFPHNVEGALLSSVDDLKQLAERGFSGFVPPNTPFMDAQRGNWLIRLAARLSDPHRAILHDAALAALMANDPATRARAIRYFYCVHSEEGARWMLQLLIEDAAGFRAPDEITDIHVDHTLDQSMWRVVARLVPWDNSARAALRAEALSGLAGRSVFSALAEHDTDWLETHMEELARAAGPANLETLLLGLSQLPPGRPLKQLKERARAALQPQSAIPSALVENSTLPETSPELERPSRELQARSRALEEQSVALEEKARKLETQSLELEQRARELQGQAQEQERISRGLEERSLGLDYKSRALEEKSRALQEQSRELDRKIAANQPPAPTYASQGSTDPGQASTAAPPQAAPTHQPTVPPTALKPEPASTPKRARTVDEMRFAASLQPCPTCATREVGTLELSGSGTQWILTGMCPQCGATRIFPFHTFGDPRLARADRFDLGDGESELITAEQFIAVIDEVLPRVPAEPPANPSQRKAITRDLHRAFIAVHELLALVPVGDALMPGSTDQRLRRPLMEKEYTRIRKLVGKYRPASTLSYDRIEGHQAWLAAGGKGPGYLSLEALDLTDEFYGPINLTFASIKNCDLTNVDMGYVILDEATLDHVTFNGATLNGSSLTNASITGGSWRGAKLSLAKFNAAVINGTDFSQSDPERSFWVNAQVTGARFDSCRFGNALFDRARFHQCSFTNAGFHTIMPDPLPSSLGAQFIECDFTGCDLSERDLRDTEFVRCKLAALTRPPKAAAGLKLTDCDVDPSAFLADS